MCAREIDKPKYEIVGQLERFDEADNAQARDEPSSCLDGRTGAGMEAAFAARASV